MNGHVYETIEQWTCLQGNGIMDNVLKIMEQCTCLQDNETIDMSTRTMDNLYTR